MVITEWISGGDTATFDRHIVNTSIWAPLICCMLTCTKLYAMNWKHCMVHEYAPSCLYSDLTRNIETTRGSIQQERLLFFACSSSTFDKRYRWSNVIYTYRVGDIIQQFVLSASRTHVRQALIAKAIGNHFFASTTTINMREVRTQQSRRSLSYFHPRCISYRKVYSRKAGNKILRWFVVQTGVINKTNA